MLLEVQLVQLPISLDLNLRILKGCFLKCILANNVLKKGLQNYSLTLMMNANIINISVRLRASAFNFPEHPLLYVLSANIML